MVLSCPDAFHLPAVQAFEPFPSLSDPLLWCFLAFQEQARDWSLLSARLLLLRAKLGSAGWLQGGGKKTSNQKQNNQKNPHTTTQTNQPTKKPNPPPRSPSKRTPKNSKTSSKPTMLCRTGDSLYKLLPSSTKNLCPCKADSPLLNLAASGEE